MENDKVYLMAMKDTNGKLHSLKLGGTGGTLSARMKLLNNEFNHSYYWELLAAKEVPSWHRTEKKLKEAFKHAKKKVWKKWGNSRECFHPSAMTDMIRAVLDA
jgi:hypothetical protein